MSERLGFKIGDPFLTGTFGASFKVTAVTPTARSLTVAPVVTPTMITHRDWGCHKNPWSAFSSSRIGDGTLTAQSREEVARITARLGGRIKP